MASQALPPEQIEQITGTITSEIGNALRAQLETIEIPSPVEIERCSRAFFDAMATIMAAAGQAGALRSLLEGAADLGARSAVFVLRDDHVQLWEGVGFETGLDQAEIPRSEPAVGSAIEGESVECSSEGSVPAPDFGQGIPGHAQFEPIRVQDKVVGLLYADAPEADQAHDVLAIRILAQVCGLAVERLALLKALGNQNEAPAEPTGPVADELPVEPAAKEVRAELPEDPVEAETVDEIVPQAPAPAPAVLPAPPLEGPVPDESPIASLSGQEEKSSPGAEDARRFARLLMEEICLYNGDKIEAGRTSQNILARVGDEVEQARAMYAQRVPPEVVAEGDFFEEAVVKVLAGGDATALGTRIAG